jgi:thymidylate kinase
MSVALLGIDGAGKSTLVAGLPDALRLPMRTIYMGLWSERGPLARNGATRMLRAALRPGQVWLRFLRGRLHQARGRVVVYDRYTYDAALPPRPPFVRLKRLYFGFLARSCPRPDLVLLLDVPSEVAALRKPEHERVDLERNRQGFLGLAARLPRFEVIDATRGVDEVRADVVERVWDAYVDRVSRP